MGALATDSKEPESTDCLALDSWSSLPANCSDCFDCLSALLWENNMGRDCLRRKFRWTNEE